MSIGLGVTHVHTSASQASLDAADNKLTVRIWKPQNVVRFGFVCTSSAATGTDLVLELWKRVTAGTSTGRVMLASFSPSVTVNQGEGAYFDLTTREEINPGEELMVDVATAGAAASTGFVHIEVVEYPFQDTSSDPTQNRLANMTQET